MDNDNPVRHKVIDRKVETMLSPQKSEHFEAKEVDDLKDELQRRSDEPNMDVQDVVVSGPGSTRFGEKGEHGKRKWETQTRKYNTNFYLQEMATRKE